MGSSLPILVFHTIENLSAPISFSPLVFRNGIAKLHEGGYQTLSLLKLVDYLRQGKPFPEHSLVITFDDGYQTVYHEAFPILQCYGMSATVFLTVGGKGTERPGDRLPPFKGRPMLSWHEIREMHRWGIDFGAHTLTHPDLTRLPVNRIEMEISHSKAIIEDALGDSVSSFAYPYGCYNKQCKEIAMENFACACSTKLGLVTAGSDLYALERIDTYTFRSDRLFDLMLTTLFPWYIRAYSISNWIRHAVQLS